MANLKEVKERIESVKNTQQITKAMKLVAASKLKKAQDRITDMRPYSDKLFGILQNILSNVEVESLDLNFSKVREEKNILVILMTSDKGLCGGFNSNLIKPAKKLLAETNAKVTLLTIGKKGTDGMKREEGIEETITTDTDLFTRLTFENASTVADFAMKGFMDGTYDAVKVIYAKFKNAATQDFTVENFLPIADFESNEETSTTNADFTFEPEKTKLVKELVPKILKTQFYRFLLDNNASEHGARMVAMDQATENANELLNELVLMYNRERQAAITTEILEIVGGAAALEQAS